jgi:hypothetical protein
MQDIQIPNLYDYLNQKNLDISTLSDLEKDALRIEYNKYRNTLYKKRQRQKHQVIEILLDKTELKLLRQKANDHKLYLSHFIKLSAIKYCEQNFIVPDRIGFQQILKLLSAIEQNIEKIAKQKNSKFSFTDSKYEALIVQIQDIKTKVLHHVINPTNATVWFESELNTNPMFRKQIISKLLNQI